MGFGVQGAAGVYDLGLAQWDRAFAAWLCWRSGCMARDTAWNVGLDIWECRGVGLKISLGQRLEGSIIVAGA